MMSTRALSQACFEPLLQKIWPNLKGKVDEPGGIRCDRLRIRPDPGLGENRAAARQLNFI